jgi:hypothetical protein
MTGRGILGLVLLAASACTPAPSPDATDAAADAPASVSEAVAAERAALSSCGAVSASGYCGIQFGMPVEQAKNLFPVTLEGYEQLPEGSDISPLRCYELFAVAPVLGVSFLIENAQVGRVDIITEAVRTDAGFGVGTQASAIRTHYGASLGVKTNELEPEITDLAATVGTTKFIFEIQDGLVRGWRAGTAPTIDYVAHCG